MVYFYFTLHTKPGVPFYLTEFTHALAVGHQPWVCTAVSGIWCASAVISAGFSCEQKTNWRIIRKFIQSYVFGDLQGHS